MWGESENKSKIATYLPKIKIVTEKTNNVLRKYRNKFTTPEIKHKIESVSGGDLCVLYFPLGVLSNVDVLGF